MASQTPFATGDPPGAKPWDRLAPYESEREHALFWQWIMLGCGSAALGRLAKQSGWSRADIGRMAHRLYWENRALSWQAHLKRIAIATAEAEAVTHGQLLAKTLNLVNDVTDAIQDSITTHKANAKASDLPILEGPSALALALKVPTAVKALQVDDKPLSDESGLDLSLLSDGELEALQRLTAKATPR